MFTCLISLLFCASVSAIPSGRREVTYPTLETLSSGMKIMKFRAFGRDMELKLEPAGDVISDNFAIMDSYGKTETTDVKSLKNKLFKDHEKGAALYIDDDGVMEINGIINSKLRIEPYESEDTVKDGNKAHLIIESSAEKKRFTDAVFSVNIMEKYYESSRVFDESECVEIQILCVTDSCFSKLFNYNRKQIEAFIASMFIVIQQIYDTLNLKIRVVLIGVVILKNDPLFLRESLIPRTNMYNVNYVLQNTSKFYCENTGNTLVVQADLIFVITCLALAAPRRNQPPFDGILGVANLGGACNQCFKCGVIHAEKDNMVDAADSMAHEAAHLLGSPHDGEGANRSLPGSPTGKNCSGKEGFIMGDDYGPNERKFSPCSKANIIYFLGLSNATCLIVPCPVE